MPSASKEKPIFNRSELGARKGIDPEGQAGENGRTNSQIHLKRAQSSGVFYQGEGGKRGIDRFTGRYERDPRKRGEFLNPFVPGRHLLI